MVDWALSGDGVFLNIRCGPSAKMGNRQTCKGFPMVSSFSYLFCCGCCCWNIVGKFTPWREVKEKNITLQKTMGSALMEHI